MLIVALDDIRDDGGRKVITKGMLYTTINGYWFEYGRCFIIGNDRGRGGWYDTVYFREVKEHRNKVLSKILE
jgi:hypothetical protein